VKVSIVVPAYNEEKRIADTLNCLKKQTYPDIELIVVNNNSQDKTGMIAKQYCEAVFLEKTPGYISAVNRGAKEATGTLITFCDADTLYPANWIQNVVNTFNKNKKAVVVYGTADTYDSNWFSNKMNGFFYTQFLRLSRLFGLDNTSGFNFVMKRDAFLKVGGYDPQFKKMSPDIELGKRLKSIGKVVFNPRIKVSSSFRRYQEGGVLSTQWMFIKSWWAMVRGKVPDIDYDQYNVDIK